MSPTYTQHELANQLKDSGAKAIITMLPLAGIALEAAREAGIARSKVILMGELSADCPLLHFRSLGRANDSGKAQNPSRPFRTDPRADLAFLVYSSGTTGKPKGVMLTHRNIISNVLMMSAGQEGYLSCGTGEPGSGDKLIGFVPFYHIYGLTGVLHLSVYRGYEVFVMTAFEIEKFCSVVQEQRITFQNVVPRVILALAKHPIVDKYDLGSIRMMTSAAAPLSKDLTKTMYRRLKIPIVQAYGLSETSPATHYMKWEEWEQKMGSVGRLLPNQECKIVSVEGGKEVDTGEVGEFWLRGPNIFKGYHKNPAATSESITPDGWFKSGDVGYVDEDGLYFITDRLKELIKYNGFQVAPAGMFFQECASGDKLTLPVELEGLLVSHPKIKDAGVVGVFSSEMETELPRAYIVVENGFEHTEATAKEINEWLNQRVASHKRLRGGIKFIDAIPASPTGKILRRELRDLASRDQAGQGSKL